MKLLVVADSLRSCSLPQSANERIQSSALTGQSAIGGEQCNERCRTDVAGALTSATERTVCCWPSRIFVQQMNCEFDPSVSLLLIQYRQMDGESETVDQCAANKTSISVRVSKVFAAVSFPRGKWQGKSAACCSPGRSHTKFVWSTDVCVQVGIIACAFIVDRCSDRMQLRVIS